MTHSRIWRAFAALSFVAAVLGSTSFAALTPATVQLSVAGRSNTAPWIASSGSFVTVVWGGTAAGKMDVFAAVSRDGGQTFARPIQVNKTDGEARLGGELPPRAALTMRAGKAEPDITVLWTARSGSTEIKTSVSTDGGRTFADATALQSHGAAGDRGWPALTVDPEGAAHAIWLDHRGLASGRAQSGGAHHKGAHDGVAMAQKSALFYAPVRAGQSVERQITAGVCYCCKTALAAGRDGSLYAAWRHVYPGNQRDMAFVVSRDGGKSFSSPVRVHEDQWAVDGCPDDGPALATSEAAVHIVWPTVVSTPRPHGALFYASTRDGKAFSAATRIPTLGSPKPSHPQIVAGAGRVFVAWDEYMEGRNVAVAREVKTSANGTPSFGEPIKLSEDGASMYPVMTAAKRGIVAVWATGGEASTIKVRALQ
jgi:hypothetical protein